MAIVTKYLPGDKRIFVNSENPEDIREPRFEMTNKECYENSKIRIIKRTGDIQILLEIYDLESGRQRFEAFRIKLSDINAVAQVNTIYENCKVHYGITETDKKSEWIEYKANFLGKRWSKPKKV